MGKKKVYLGDAVYAEYDGGGDFILTTEDGIRATNRIVLEPNVITALLLFVETINAEGEEATDD